MLPFLGTLSLSALVFFFFTCEVLLSTDDVACLHACWVIEAVDGGGEFWWWRLLHVVEVEEWVVCIEVVLIGCGLRCIDGWLWE